MLSVGQKVLCIDDRPPGFQLKPREKLPTAGSVYTIRYIVPRSTYHGWDDDGVLLVEIHNPMLYRPKRKAFRELHFRARRFRPVRSANIDIFTQMLEPAPARDPEFVD